MLLPQRRLRALRLDAGDGGLGLLVLGGAPERGTPIPVVAREGVRWTRVAHARRVVPGVWRVGLAYLDASVAQAEARGYLAA
jgi:cellulose synthase (UDP-forming)